jgi:HlyD family secretion protein
MKTKIIILFLIVLIACNTKSGHQYTGILEGTAVKIPALTGGEIKNILVETGDQVKKGQIIALIDSTELYYEYQQNQATLADLDIQTEIARTNFKRAEEELDYMRQKHTRIAKLYKTNSTTEQNLDDITNKLQMAEATANTAKNSIRGLQARRQQLQAKKSIIKKKILDTVVKAPSNGIVTEKYFESGEAIPPLNAIVEIVDISEVDTKIYIAENMLSKIQHGQNVSVHIDGLDKELTGKIIWISPKAEFTPKTILTPDTRTSLVYAVKVLIQNEEGILKDGMPVVISLDIP